MSKDPDFLAPIAERIWRQKYQFRPASEQGGDARGGDIALADTFNRVATAAASAEPGGAKAKQKWMQRFYDSMADFGFIPAGRILAGAGTGREVTLFNCFVMDTIGDDLSDIFDNVREAALTLQQGGGIGHDFSTLRPKGALVQSVGADASGPVSFMDVWDAMCRTIMSAGTRRGAMMATLRCDHPDIEAFIDAKKDPARLRNFNLSVLVTDAFMDAVQKDAPWPLIFNGKVYRTVEARSLWNRIMRATYDYAEPGVIFIDRVNRRNNLAYCETISATNPCGEQPLPPYGACLLGSINLTAFVKDAFTTSAALDLKAIKRRVRVATRLLDNVIDISNYPLTAQHQEALAKRRIGLGLTGLADTLAVLGIRYGSNEAAQHAANWMQTIQNAAYQASARLAKRKGAFPLYDEKAMFSQPNLAALDPKTRKLIRRHGLRNGCLTSIAPTGTISLLAGNVSSGVEPIYDYRYKRRVLKADGTRDDLVVEDYAVAAYRRRFGADADLPPAFTTARDLTPFEHLKMQAALQPHVDSSISKTINCPEHLPFDDFKSIYAHAYSLGLKGCTTYRPNPVTGAVLETVDAGQAQHAPQQGSAPVPDPEAILSAEHQPRPALDIVPPAGANLARPAGLPAASPAAGLTPPAFDAQADANTPPGDVIYVSKPLARDTVLTGATYKLKWPESDNALYITINDVEVGGRKRPFEIFINTRHLEHYAWTVALTRMISAVFRRGGDVSFVAEELKAIFDPQGGRWMQGRYVPSLLAAIGEIIEKHMVSIGFLKASPEAPSDQRNQPDLQDASPAKEDHQDTGASPSVASSTGPPSSSGRPQRVAGGFCPRCSSPDYVRQESCWTCLQCGFSRCD